MTTPPSPRPGLMSELRTNHPAAETDREEPITLLPEGPEMDELIERLRELAPIPSVYRWTGSDEGLEDLFDLGLRHKSGLTPYDYLKAWLNMLRPFAYATEDDSWGEMEKLLCIVLRNYVRLKVAAGEAADALAARAALEQG